MNRKQPLVYACSGCSSVKKRNHADFDQAQAQQVYIAYVVPGAQALMLITEKCHDL